LKTGWLFASVLSCSAAKLRDSGAVDCGATGRAEVGGHHSLLGGDQQPRGRGWRAGNLVSAAAGQRQLLSQSDHFESPGPQRSTGKPGIRCKRSLRRTRARTVQIRRFRNTV